MTNIENSFHKDLQLIRKISKMDYAKNELGFSCLPARFKLPPFEAFINSFTGQYAEEFDQAAVSKKANGRATEALLNKLLTKNKVSIQDINPIFKLNYEVIHCWGAVRRFQIENGRLFTLTSALIKRLSQFSKPSEQIGAKFFLPPCDNTYFEFGTAEDRKENNHDFFVSYMGGHRAIEGVYISNLPVDNETLSQEMKDHFNYDSSIPHRLIEIAPTISPTEFKSEGQDIYVAASHSLLMRYMTLFVSDEMSLNECIDLNIQWLKKQFGHEDFQSYEQLINLLSNAILYIGLDSRIEKKFKFIDTDRQVSSKTKKIKDAVVFKNCANTVSKYNRIQIGSTKPFVPFKYRSKNPNGSNGTKSPHVRRRYFAPRIAKDENGNKIKKICAIKQAIIHEEMLTKEEVALIKATYEVL